MELVGALAGSTATAFDGLYRVNELLENLGVVDVRAGEQNRERHASGVGDDVALGAGPAAI